MAFRKGDGQQQGASHGLATRHPGRHPRGTKWCPWPSSAISSCNLHSPALGRARWVCPRSAGRGHPQVFGFHQGRQLPEAESRWGAQKTWEFSSPPYPEALVLPTACHSLAIWTPVDSIHLIRVARQVCGQLLGLHIPHLQRAVTAATDQEPAVG
uniref:Notchless protein homolog 1 isoform X1 n=1 Tax=Sus scrofa TaxID=9823 RepID=A0A480HWH7_PIG